MAGIGDGMTTDDDKREIAEIVRRARSAFSAGNKSQAASLICDAASRLKKDGKSALYRQALEQVSVELAALLDTLDEIPQIPELDL